MSKHTQAPWEMAGPVGRGTWIQSERNPNIAAVHGAYTDEGMANAKLIAAAPELLEALKELLESYYAMMPPYEDGKSSQDAWADRRAAARNNATALIERLS